MEILPPQGLPEHAEAHTAWTDAFVALVERGRSSSRVENTGLGSSGGMSRVGAGADRGSTVAEDGLRGTVEVLLSYVFFLPFGCLLVEGVRLYIKAPPYELFISPI